MGSNAKNVTFNLPIELIERYKQFAKMNYIPSMNAGVKEALEEYVIKLEKEKLKKEMAEASTDSLFMEDLKENMDAFEHSDNDGTKESTEW
jgi:predicted DNA-binding protein